MNILRKQIAGTLILLSGLAYGQEVKDYNLEVDIDVKSKTIYVNGIINIDFKQQDSIALVLWKDTKIKSISHQKQRIPYTFYTTKPFPNHYIDGYRLTIKNPSLSKKGVLPLSFNYQLDMSTLENWAESFTENWIQIGFYSAWFPLQENNRNTTSKISISIDKEYQVSGSGIIKKKGKRWKMTQKWNSFDNVILASKRIKSKKLESDKATIEIIYTVFPEKDVNATLEACQDILDYFSQIYPKQDKAYLKFLISPKGQGGYSRANFISLSLDEFTTAATFGMSHEVSHFWANGANPTQWEDWLNESFAEYSALMYTRDRVDEERFNEIIERYKKSTENVPPIWQVDRTSQEAYNVLYKKGAVLLYEFEKRIGKTEFVKILQLKHQQKIENTKQFLNLVEKQISKETRDWLEKELKT